MNAERTQWPAIVSLVSPVAPGLVACAEPPRSGMPAETPQLAATAAGAADPVNIAHRGASAYAPEHTLAAYTLAIEMAADYVEQDLQLTRDGVLICMHDTTLNRTTNVAEVFPDRATEVEMRGDRRRVWRVSDSTLEEIKRLDAGSWFGDEFAGARVPTFQEAIDLVKGKAGMYPETKAPEEYEALGLTMEEELARVFAANALDTPAGQAATPIYVQSFSPDSLKRMQAVAGDTYRLVQLIGRGQESLLSEPGLAEVASYASGVGPAIPLLVEDPSRGRAARDHGLELHPYTVSADRLPEGHEDAGTYMRYLFHDLRATGVFTDNPDLFPRH